MERRSKLRFARGSSKGQTHRHAIQPCHACTKHVLTKETRSTALPLPDNACNAPKIHAPAPYYTTRPAPCHHPPAPGPSPCKAAPCHTAQRRNSTVRYWSTARRSRRPSAHQQGVRFGSGASHRSQRLKSFFKASFWIEVGELLAAPAKLPLCPQTVVAVVNIVVVISSITIH